MQIRNNTSHKYRLRRPPPPGLSVLYHAGRRIWSAVARDRKNVMAGKSARQISMHFASTLSQVRGKCLFIR